MKASTKNLFVIALAIYSTTTFSFNGIKPIETSFMSANAGAGVGAVLLNESPILNPASVVPMKESSFYYQKGSTVLSKQVDARTGDYKEGDNQLIILTDTSAGFSGGFSYQFQKTAFGQKTSYSSSIAKSAGKKTAIGVILTYSKEESQLIEEDYTQLKFGMLHFISNRFTIGATITDPGQEVSDYFKYTAGLQYTVNNFFVVFADIGSGDVQNHEVESFNKWSIQLKTFERVMLRYGRFYDRLLNEKGTATGVSWVGPKFSIDYALKYTELINKNADTLLEENYLKDEQIIESSVGLTVLF